jgi:hypothetical protein
MFIVFYHLTLMRENKLYFISLRLFLKIKNSLKTFKNVGL